MNIKSRVYIILTLIKSSIFNKISVEPGLLFFYAGIYFLYTAFQPLIFQRTCEQYLISINSTYTCDNVAESQGGEIDEIVRKVSHWIRYTSICYSLPSLLTDILLGSWSDYFGRKLPLTFPSIGQVLATIFYIAIALDPSIPVYVFCIASAVAGVLGGPTSTISACFSFVTSISDNATRTSRLAVLQSMTYIAGALTPFLAGAVLEASNPAVVYAVSGGFFAMTVLYCLFLKEPSTEKKKLESYRQLFSPVHLQDSFNALVKQRPFNVRSRLILLVVAYFIVQVITGGGLDILYLFLTGLGYTQLQFSYYFGFKMLTQAVAVLIFLPVAKHFGASDLHIAYTGLAAKILGFIAFGLSTTTPLLIFSGVIDGLGGWAIPALNSLISQLVDAGEVGKIFGVVAFNGDVSLLTASVIFNSLYPELKPYHQGATHFLAGGLLFISVILLTLTVWLARSEREPQKENRVESRTGVENNGFANDSI